MSYADILKSRGISASGADNESWSEASKPANKQPSNEGSGTIDLRGPMAAYGNMVDRNTQTLQNQIPAYMDGVQSVYDQSIINRYEREQDNPKYGPGAIGAVTDDQYNQSLENQKKRKEKQSKEEAEANVAQPTQDKNSGFSTIFNRIQDRLKEISDSNLENVDTKKTIDTPANYNGDLSHAQIYDEFAYEMPDYGYTSLPELLGSGDARAAYDYMRFANNRYGRYGDLADYFNYDESDENAAQAAFDSYVSGYFNPTRNELSVSDLADVNDDAARILGSYAGDRDAFMNYFMDNFASNYALANAAGDYQLGYDELGNPTIYSATGMPYLTSDMDDYEDTLRDMWTTNILRSAYNSQLNGDSSLSDSQIEQLLSYYTNDNIQDTIDFGKLGNNIPDSDMLYSAAGLDTYTPEMVNLLGDTNLGDLALYYNNPNFVPMYSQALASQMGVGSNLDSYSDAELEAFAQMVGLADISEEDQKKEK